MSRNLTEASVQDLRAWAGCGIISSATYVEELERRATEFKPASSAPDGSVVELLGPRDFCPDDEIDARERARIAHDVEAAGMFEDSRRYERFVDAATHAAIVLLVIILGLAASWWWS